MNREERRRQARGQRKASGGDDRPHWQDWTPTTNQIRRIGVLDPARAQAEEQDFIAGTVFAAGAAAVLDDGKTPGPAFPPLFVVLLRDDDTTWGPAPRLRQLLAAVEARGADVIGDQLEVASGWSLLLSDKNPLVKLKMDVRAPDQWAGLSAQFVLLGGNYRDHWWRIADGGMIGLTTEAKVAAVNALPNPSYADMMSACVLFGVGVSPGLHSMIRLNGWPTGPTDQPAGPVPADQSDDTATDLAPAVRTSWWSRWRTRHRPAE